MQDPAVVEAMYTTKNKYFDKHPLIKDLCYPLIGDSILFAETTQDWKKSRKAMSPAFYKGKLVQLVEIAKLSVEQTLLKFEHMTKNSQTTQIDVVEELGEMTVRILLRCAFGEDLSDVKIDQWIQGKLTKVTLANALRDTF